MQLIQVTLEDVLSARERRAEKQRQILSKYPVPLISFMVNIPGAYKDTPLSRMVFEEGLAVILKESSRKRLVPIYQEANYYFTGPEAYLAVDWGAIDLKRATVAIEDFHPLGRLFDIDVIAGNQDVLSRVQIGKTRRKCLICNEDAAACGRSGRHSVEELLRKVRAIAEEYFQPSSQGNRFINLA